MNDFSGRDELEDVLNAYMAAASTPNAESLAEWIRRYPQYERELTEFAVAWSRTRWFPAVQRPSDDDDTSAQRAMRTVQAVLHEKAASLPSSQQQQHPIDSLLAEARSHGLSMDQLADRIELSAALVRKLDRRLIRYVSMPLAVIENLAGVVERQVLAVARYLDGAPVAAQGARYRAERAPALADQEDFFDAVQNDPELSEERRGRWLALKPTRQ